MTAWTNLTSVHIFPILHWKLDSAAVPIFVVTLVEFTNSVLQCTVLQYWTNSTNISTNIETAVSSIENGSWKNIAIYCKFPRLLMFEAFNSFTFSFVWFGRNWSAVKLYSFACLFGGNLMYGLCATPLKGCFENFLQLRLSQLKSKSYSMCCTWFNGSNPETVPSKIVVALPYKITWLDGTGWDGMGRIKPLKLILLQEHLQWEKL